MIQNYPQTNVALQINAVKRAIGVLSLRIGVMQVRDAISDFTDTEGTFQQFCKPLLGLQVAEMDSKYYFTSWDNWQKVIATINPILSQFNWVADRFDCDKRAELVMALTALFFEINTIRPVYCDVYYVSTGGYAYTHYANVIVDNSGNAWLWDVDNSGLFGRITSNPVIVGALRYQLKAVK